MIGLVLTATISTVPDSAGPYPVDFDKVVRADLQGELKDYESARITILRGPRLATYLRPAEEWYRPKTVGPIWYVCYSVNAKNSYGAYTGAKTYMIGIVAGSVRFERQSPYFNEYSGRYRDDATVTAECSKFADEPSDSK